MTHSEHNLQEYHIMMTERYRNFRHVSLEKNAKSYLVNKNIPTWLEAQVNF